MCACICARACCDGFHSPLVAVFALSDELIRIDKNKMANVFIATLKMHCVLFANQCLIYGICIHNSINSHLRISISGIMFQPETHAATLMLSEINYRCHILGTAAGATTNRYLSTGRRAHDGATPVHVSNADTHLNIHKQIIYSDR